MQHDEDIAFQRAILANPDDTTLKLVYADWLQDRDDPRSEYLRLQVEVLAVPWSLAQATQRLINMGRCLDPVWIGFMTSLAQPFEPFTFQQGEPGYTFTEPIGLRGRVAVFESQHRGLDALNSGLLADLAFLTSIEWGECAFAMNHCDVDGFICELPKPSEPLTAREVLVAIKVADFQDDRIGTLDAIELPYTGYQPDAINDEMHSDFTAQYIFANGTAGAEMLGTHGALKRYVKGGRLWYALLRARREPFSLATLLAVGHSPYGNQLVGAIVREANLNS